MTRGQRIQKRSFDLAAAVAGLAVFWPLIAVCWVLARRDTGASGFFRQTRIGQGARRFRIVKLRTMRDGPGGSVTAAGDPRITKLGARLRRWKLDELPQLWNVLLGLMSLVGPRPDVPGYLDRLEGEDRALWALRPGITGPATLHFRHEEALLAAQPDPEAYNRDVIWPEKLRLNRAYLANWSFVGDVRYILCTVFADRPRADRLDFVPVVIIGAPRSGTNALRDMICRLPDFATWPCDEINPIWRHGNLGWPDDALPPARATAPVRAFVRRAFARQWRRAGHPRFVVEKTCANSLRVPFVEAILPEAKYIFILRDGRDVVASAERRWRGRMEMRLLPYLLAKARATPLVDLPAYAWRTLRRRVQLFAGGPQAPTWGPRLPAPKPDLTSLPLRCAEQWIGCAEAAETALSQIEPARVLRLKYEAMVADPQAALERILTFLGTTTDGPALSAAAATLHAASVGRGPRSRGDELAELLAPALRRFGYGEA